MATEQLIKNNAGEARNTTNTQKIEICSLHQQII